MNVKQVYNNLDVLVRENPDRYFLTAKICNSINRLPLEYGNVLLGLIYGYYVSSSRIAKPTELDLVSRINKKNGTLGLPYKGKTFENGKGPQFEVDKLPPKLQKIIAAYITLISI